LDDSRDPSKNIMIVETFVEMEKPKKAENISNLDNLKQGRLTREKGYSYFSNTRFMVESDSAMEFKTTEKDNL